jgi:hypothetical protein
MRIGIRIARLNLKIKIEIEEREGIRIEERD